MKTIKMLSLLINLLLLTPSMFCQDLSLGLQGHHKFNQNLLDLSPNEITGEGFAIISEIGIEDLPESSYLYNGLDAHINLSNDNRNIIDQLTISAWVKTDTSKRQFIISKYNSTEDKGYFLAIDQGLALIGGRNSSNVFTECIATTRIDDGKWHHILGVIRNNSWNIWVDCNLENTTKTNASNVRLFCNDLLTIGNWHEGIEYGNGRFFDGSIDEVRIYNRSITEAEIELLCNLNFVPTTYLSTQLLEIKIIPNPVFDVFKVSITESITEEIQYNVYDNLGRLVKHGVLEGFISMTDFSRGHYVLQLTINNKTVAVEKIILQ